jgi:hypothetical protein
MYFSSKEGLITFLTWAAGTTEEFLVTYVEEGAHWEVNTDDDFARTKYDIDLEGKFK